MREDKLVFVIIGKGYTEHEVRQEIKEEGYPYTFHFGMESEAFHSAEEIWVFGEPSEVAQRLLDFAMTVGTSIWIMG